nr:DNA repair and recombination protein RAD54B [Kwoniella mangroviensis CBS 8507]OCF63274.1 DNA repair and recombination protein RAD54B [Kwoniella mangroviensis CBS 8507]
MTYSPSGSKPKRGLGAIIDSIPTQADRIPDSCSEGSDSASDDDDDEVVGVGSIATPQPIPLTPQVGASRSSSKGKGRAVDSPRVEMSVGVSGRNVYQVVTPGKFAEYFAVQWRKPQQKKHSEFKTWDGDAFIKVEGNKITMIDEDGNYKGVTGKGERDVCADQELRIGGFDVLVDREVSEQEFKAGTTILNRPKASSILGPTAYRATTFTKPFKAPTQTHAAKPVAGYIPGRTASGGLTAAPPGIPLSQKPEMPISKPIAAQSFYGPSVIKPKGNRIVLGEKSSKERMEWGGALFNPNAEGAVVMPRPPEKLLISCPFFSDLDVVDVVVDPILGSLLRKHQKEGVQFMYSCVMGYTAAEAEGCILADDMGLGKTLQSITLMHTLLYQSPFDNQSQTIQKVLIVCPVTLVENWRKEFKKWTSAKTDKRINVLVADGTNYRVSSFINNKNMQVLIIGYERLASCQPPIGLIVCDEGQRLKSKDNKTKKMFDALSCQRRIILSGTPIQNDLAEYWAMVDFTCPGMLGRYNAFNKQYEKPIMAGRAVGANPKVVELGEERASELHKLSKEFVLRRTADVMENFLPPKNEYVLFVAPSLLQLSVLARLLNPSIVGGFIRGGAGTQSLALIDMMRKISNSPMLLRKKDDEGSMSDEIGSALSEAKSAIPLDINVNDVTTSGKMLVLDKMLHSIHQETTEKVVVVSNWTATLNLIQDMCKIRKYPYLRLDGSTPQKQRQELVDSFNRDVRREDSFVFLLSAKAGGVGLNLIGGSRLFLFDSDWNPSTDLQAMARIHRDGQKRPVCIYRLLTTNAIDEKIYQRQITKMGLSDQMMEQGETGKESKDSFSHAELRDIFTLNLNTDGCQTHDLLGCDCTVSGKIAETTSEETSTVAEDDDDGDEEKARFVNAAQYDPKPSAKMLRKTAAEQQQKLRALRKWTHYDTYDHHSFRNIMDVTLYNMLYESWDSDESALLAAASAEEGGRHKTKKKRRIVENDEDDDADEETPDKVLDSASEEDDDDGSDSEGSTSVPSKRKKSGIANKRKSRSKNDFSEEYEDPLGMGRKKKHDLKKIAENGGTGRVMFVFEKVSKAKMK